MGRGVFGVKGSGRSPGQFTRFLCVVSSIIGIITIITVANMLLCEQCKSMSKPLFLLLLLLSWRVYEVVGMQLQSREISVESKLHPRLS